MLKLDNFPKIAAINIEHLKHKAFEAGKALAIRLFDIGDVYDVDVMRKIIELCHLQEDVVFYHYTKQVSLVKRYLDNFGKPKNLVTIYSYGGREDKAIKDSDRHSKVFTSLEELEACGYVDASSDDSIAFTSSNNKIGLVYH